MGVVEWMTMAQRLSWQRPNEGIMGKTEPDGWTKRVSGVASQFAGFSGAPLCSLYVSALPVSV
jgi:hypothetical protein